MSTTESTPNYIKDYYIVCSISGFFALIAVFLSCMILVVTWRTKPRLHTVRHVLMCNTCIASICYCIVQIINYYYLIFLPDRTDDVGCRWRGYFSYVTISAVTYSFFIQAVSRLFIAIFSTKYKWLTTFKVHFILIGIQWPIAIIFPLPAIITVDIYFRPRALCWVPLRSLLHVIYTFVMYYIAPTLLICIIYLYIFFRVKKIANRSEMLIGTRNNEKRNLELLRNILILLFIYLAGGIPTFLFIVTSNRILYLIGIVTISLTVAIEKLCTIILDRELRQVIRRFFCRDSQIVPMRNTYVVEQIENYPRFQRTTAKIKQTTFQ
uniref:7 transmembrane receptor 2 n=1 Tax=Adineta vaga TaxID=104782 RepID=B3G3Z3_ADIVA|nr:7 transmembrane receptor 2 [Adineta vaga]